MRVMKTAPQNSYMPNFILTKLVIRLAGFYDSWFPSCLIKFIRFWLITTFNLLTVKRTNGRLWLDSDASVVNMKSSIVWRKSIIRGRSGQIERMDQTIKEAIVKRYYYETSQQLKEHVQLFLTAYNFASWLTALSGLTLITNTSSKTGKMTKNVLR